MTNCIYSIFRREPVFSIEDRPQGKQAFRRDGIVLLQNGTAKQLVVFCHGAWKPVEQRPFPLNHVLRQKGDGIIENYQGPRIDFYAPDGSGVKGATVLNQISMFPEEAFIRLEPRHGLSYEKLAESAAAHGNSIEEENAELLKPAVRCWEQVFSGESVKDYSLTTHLQNADFEKDYFAGKFSPDIDIALVTEPHHKRHLSDVLAAVEASAAQYEVIHMAACRSFRPVYFEVSSPTPA